MKRKILLRVLLVIAALCFSMVLFYGLSYRKSDQDYKNLQDQFSDEKEVSIQSLLIEEPPNHSIDTPAPTITAASSSQAEDLPAKTGLESINYSAIDHQGLEQTNSDYIGWIVIPGTRINYPLLLPADNEFYLTHNFNQDKDRAGALFVDAAIEKGLDAKNVIVHGHNMRNGSMFASLSNYRSLKYYLKNPYVLIYASDGRTFVYEVCAAYEIDGAVDDLTIYRYAFPGQNQFQQYIDNLNHRNILPTGISLSNDDNLLTLSTCVRSGNNRFIVHAQMLHIIPAQE